MKWRNAKEEAEGCFGLLTCDLIEFVWKVASFLINFQRNANLIYGNRFKCLTRDANVNIFSEWKFIRNVTVIHKVVHSAGGAAIATYSAPERGRCDRIRSHFAIQGLRCRIPVASTWTGAISIYLTFFFFFSCDPVTIVTWAQGGATRQYIIGGPHTKFLFRRGRRYFARILITLNGFSLRVIDSFNSSSMTRGNLCLPAPL